MFYEQSVKKNYGLEILTDPFYYHLRQVFVLIGKKSQNLLNTDSEWSFKQKHEKLKRSLAILWIFG
jgi:hypothetical protein